MDGRIVGIAAVVVVSAARSAFDRVVVGFDHGEVHWHDDRGCNQRDTDGSENPEERSLVERLGPSGREISMTVEALLANSWKQWGGVGCRVHLVRTVGGR